MYLERTNMQEDFLGLKVVEDTEIKCGNCNVPLINVVVVETNDDRKIRGLKPQKSQYQVQCYKCHGSSFKTKVFEGSTIIAGIADFITVDTVDTDILNNGVVFSKLLTKKD